MTRSMTTDVRQDRSPTTIADAGVVLETERLAIGYPSLAPIRTGVDLRLRRGTLIGLVGPNGIGKSTLLETIAGLLRPLQGRILHDGEDVTRLGPAARRLRGISLVREGRRIFPSLSVEENLLVARRRVAAGPARSDAEALEWAYSTFPVLANRRDVSGTLLSGGEQQMLAIARATIQRPQILLADEPFRGLHWRIMREVAEKLHEMCRDSIAVFVADESERSLEELGVEAIVRFDAPT